jgi:hypothetical protein
MARTRRARVPKAGDRLPDASNGGELAGERVDRPDPAPGDDQPQPLPGAQSDVDGDGLPRSGRLGAVPTGTGFERPGGLLDEFA